MTTLYGSDSREQEASEPTTFIAMLEQRWQQGSFVCIGLDLEYSRLPTVVKNGRSHEGALFTFGRAIVDATHDVVCAYKPNSAFYEAQGDEGLHALTRIVHYIKDTYPTIPVILDAKRADIGSTNLGYATSAFDLLGVDAITVHPYLGKEALAPFLARKEKGIIVLVKTSNPGSGEFQDLLVGETREPLYQIIARNVALHWNTDGNCAVVVGATYPAELQRVRSLIGNLPILIPGVGAQGGDVATTVRAGKDSRGWGIIINSSRSIIYASSEQDFAQTARNVTVELNTEINRHRV